MCACRCGIRVYLKDGTVRYIEGNPDHPVNRGVLCAKGAAGIMQHYSPARLTRPLLRVGERGSGEFKEIEWDEALDLATGWLSRIRATDPKQLAFFTGHDQSQSLTGWWAQQFGTLNYAAHGGFCSVNMAAAGFYTIGGSFWEFGEPDWKHTKYFMMFGVAEDHASNPIKIGLGKLKSREDTKFISINPIRTGYSAIADEWVGIRPGTDGLFIFSLIHELLRAEKIDWEYLVRYTNSHWLVVQAPGTGGHGLFARDAETDKPADDTGKTDTPLGGMPLGFPTAPGDLLTMEDGSPQRIDKAFSWEYPLAIHGMMHTVIHNAWKADPYKIDTLFLYMANMAWNSSMNTRETLEYLTDKNEETGEYKIPHVIYSDAYYSETVPCADLVLPDTTYLERWDCISLLDRPIGEADAVADSIRQPVLQPDRDVRPFQDVLLELGRRLGLPGMAKADGTAKHPGGYADYIVNHMRTDRIGPLAGWRGKDGDKDCTGPPNPDQLKRYIDNGCFWRHEFAPEQRYYKFANKAYLNFAHNAGWIHNAQPIVIQLYNESLQRFRLAADGHGYYLPPEQHRDRIRAGFDPLPAWYEPFEHNQINTDNYPLHALTQRPMHMYHSWGSQNAWLRQITSFNRLHLHYRTAQKLGVTDDDWVWVESPHGRVKAQVKCMNGVNPDTVWTWNAIGKRSDAWNLDENAPEVEKGFLLNHIISELLPENKDGYRYVNADPVTGQAAWFDLRVRIEKCKPQEITVHEPRFSALPQRLNGTVKPDVLKFGNNLTGETNGVALDNHTEYIGNFDEANKKPGGNQRGSDNPQGQDRDLP